MATDGNNFKLENTIIRDSFMTPSESAHTKDLLTGLMHGLKIPRLSEDNIGVANYSELYMKVMGEIADDKLGFLEFQHRKLLSDYLLGASGEYEDKPFKSSDFTFMRIKASNEVKNIICRILTEMVEDNKFNEKQMNLVEDYMAVLLASIVDVHMSQELER